MQSLSFYSIFLDKTYLRWASRRACSCLLASSWASICCWTPAVTNGVISMMILLARDASLREGLGFWARAFCTAPRTTGLSWTVIRGKAIQMKVLKAPHPTDLSGSNCFLVNNFPICDEFLTQSPKVFWPCHDNRLIYSKQNLTTWKSCEWISHSTLEIIREC